MATEEASWSGAGHEVADGTLNEHSDQQVDNTQDPHASGDATENGSDPSNESQSGNENRSEGDAEEGEESNDDGDDDIEEVDEEEEDDDEQGGHGEGQAPDEEEDDDEGSNGDYDPETVTFDVTPSAQETAPAAAPQRAASKPKVSGGFVLEASEDEDEESTITTAPGAQGAQPTAQPSATSTSAPTPTLAFPPNMPPALAGIDPVMMLEARIKEDPRGDMDAWLNLIADYRRRSRYDDARSVYNRFFEVFPTSAEMWVDWLEMELDLDNFVEAEKLFGRSLRTVPSVRLLTVYLNYIRRRNDLNNDPTGIARQTITQSYEFVLDTVGMDRESGDIWQDYVQFVKNAPGDIRGTSWKDQQKMDQVRAVYQRAIGIPMSTVNTLWKEYDQFEMSLNKLTGRKFIQERSPGYMSAKSANIALDNITRGLRRTTIPRLPPAPGFDGAESFREQVQIWKRWIAFEKDDPLVLASDESESYRKRVLYCYNQALMALRFWPELWVDAAEWCFANGVRENDREVGLEMLAQGITANPESVLLALKHADYIETNYPGKEGDKSEYAKAVRKPFDEVLETLYAMGDKVKEREKMEISTIKQAAAQETPVQASIEQREDDDDGEHGSKKSPAEERVAAIQAGYATESQLLSRTISHIWIALARVMRRIQGKGNQTDGGLRKVFTDARQKGRLTSDVYVAVALLESVVYKDPVGAKIFERGARLFPNDEMFMVEYLKFLHSRDDTTNARVVFETCVNRLVAKPETLFRAKPLYSYFHKYESQYGELSQISRLEDRMAELFPDDPRLQYFTGRYSSEKFDPVAAPLIISKAVQMRPKQMMAMMEQPIARQSSIVPRLEQSPRPQYIRATASPKRPLVDDEELNPPKRLARGASPLKGAAGRRLDQQRRNQSSALHRDITFLLGILPSSHSYDTQRLSASGLVGLLRDTHLPDYTTWKSQSGGQRFPGAGHSRQVSTEMPGRPISPYGRLGSAATGYKNSPLRTETGGHLANPYAPPDGGAPPQGWAPSPASYGQPPAGQFGGYRY